MIRLTESQAELIRGEYKPYHECIPVKIEDRFYILHEEIKDVPELAKKLDFTPLERFIKGDKSELDLKYKAHLKRQEALFNAQTK